MVEDKKKALEAAISQIEKTYGNFTRQQSSQ